MRVGVLVSGQGSNLLALLEAFPAGHAAVQIVCVVSNRPNCAALEHGRRAGVPAYGIAPGSSRSRHDQQAAITAKLTEAGVELLVLAGFDQVLGPAVLVPFQGRVINVHPSLLPAFGGTLHAQAEALEYGVKVTGCTVHYVTAEVDGGPIIAQAAVPVFDDDDLARLRDRILAQEHRLLPEVVTLIAAGRVHVEGRHVRIDALPR